MWPGDVNDIMHRKRAEDLGDLKKSESWVPVSEEDSWLSELAEALHRLPHVVGIDGKVSIERLCLSLLMSKTFKLKKVIKSFVPELRSRKFFFEFRDSYVNCIWVMNILCTFHIFMYGYVTLIELNAKQGGLKYHFLSLWYELDLDWNADSRTIGEHSTH